MGVAAGVVGACLVAAFADSLANLVSGAGQEIFNASVMAIAVVMLAAHNVWMARTGRQMGQDMQSLGSDVAGGRRSLLALAVVVGVAVLREGSEVALFLYGVALSEGGNWSAMLIGGATGIALGGLVSAVMYFGLVKIPTRYVFSVTSRLIALLAAGMAAQAVVFLQQAGLVSVYAKVVWDTSSVVSEGSIAGKALHSLIGYADRPTGLQLIAYLTTLVAIFTLMRLFGSAASARKSPNMLKARSA